MDVQVEEPKAEVEATYIEPVPSTKRKEIVEAAIEELYKKHGVITQAMLVREARSPSSPLHQYFEWDDSIAAEKYREQQALHMILASKFVVLLKKQDHAVPNVTKGVAVEVRRLLPALGGGGFQMRNEVLNEETARTALVKRKKKQLEGWCREASDIEELSPLREAILKLL